MNTSAAPQAEVNVAENLVYRIPTSHAQRRFWTASQLHPGSATFNVAVRWRLEGKIDVRLMERACDLLIARHEALRTTIVSDGDEILQEIRPELSCSLKFSDLSDLPAADRSAAVDEMAVSEARIPFSLSESPLVRFGLIRVEPQLHILMCTAHHAVCDGLSVGVLANDIGEIYDALSRGEQPQLAEQELQYADYAIWEEENPRTEQFEKELEFWRKTLSGARSFEVPTDSPRQKSKTVAGHIVSRLLPRTLTDPLATLSHEHGCTLFTTCLAGLSVLLQRLGNASDLTIGTQVLGRDRVEIERVVGVFTNTLALRVDASGDPTAAQFLDRVRRVVTEALENQDVPFDRVIGALGIRHDPARHPLFQVHFIYQRSFVQNRTYENFALVDMPSRSPGASFDLNFFMVERVDGWRLSCEYNTDLFRQSTVEWMLQEMEAILGRFGEHMQTRLSEFPVSARPHLEGEHKSEIQTSAVVSHKLLSNDLSETVLSMLFQEVLGLTSVGPEENFFDLGGHSILAARLLTKIERNWRIRLSLADLVESPTPRAIVASIGRNSLIASDRVVPLQRGTRDPLFVISQSLVFHNIAKALGTDRSVYAIRMLEEDAKKLQKPQSMEAIAAYYVRLLKAVHPEGPYRLAGWCVAAKIAYEVAQQLKTAGNEVELLVLVDSWAPGYMRDMTPMKRALIDAAYAVHRTKLRVQTLRKGESAKQKPEDLKPTPVEEIEYAAVETYRPVPYSGRVVLCCSAEQPSGGIFDPTMGWGKYLEPMPPIHRVEGSHLTMFEPKGAAFIASKILEASVGVSSTEPHNSKKVEHGSLLRGNEGKAHAAL